MIPDGAKDPKAFALYISVITAAFADGKTIEVKSLYGADKWRDLEGSPVWNWRDYVYRIAQPKKPSIDWGHVHPDFNFLYIDQFNVAVLCTDKVELTDETWLPVDVIQGCVRRVGASTFSSYDRGDCAWQDSLVMRPGWVSAILERASK